ncbi:Protein of unknown function [Pseudomonas pohangensis]|uniref:Thymidine phosphorylase n=1 Tax=Pseudomonas pohangensis TaxID=364197 RepID=A0A1H2E517_9PSED|nr:DUF1631 domain-containing protein [Pseudomonas pohangensis]SDT89778.1 Protein of unknown function [Pseudomonas pohangensis]
MSTQDTQTGKADNPSSLASRGIQPRFTDLVQNCKKLVMNRLAEHLTGVFSNVDDKLFECAEKAENNQVQTLYFDSMRDIRRLRPQIERAYHQQIAQNFSDFMEGKLKPPPAVESQIDAENLSLVENEDYEELMQVTNMVSRVRSRSAQAIFTLDQRLALLNNGQKLFEDSNPFGPQAIVRAFSEALEPHPLPLRIKHILYMLFDQHVMHGLDAIYDALNRLLIEAGVLPNLKYSVQRTAAQPRRTPSTNSPVADAEPAAAAAGQNTAQHHAPSAGNTPGQGGSLQAHAGSQQTAGAGNQGPGIGAAQSDPEGLYNDLSALLVENRQHGASMPLLGGTPSIASFAPTGATRTYSANELLEALNRLQAESAQDIKQRLHQPQKVESLKASLHQELDTHSSEPGKQKLSDQEADVIDLVGMLFDFILDDDNLPDNCKTTLSHLHTPYLKVALQDKALFTQHHHPARRLLNTMAQAGVMYGGEGDERGLLSKMHWVVERVIHGFAGDFMLFETLLEEFNEYVTTLKHKVELRERRAIEAAKGRDKLLGARQMAAEVISQALEKRSPPAIIRNFLELTWIDVLVFVLLRHGEHSDEWKRTGEVAEELAWSGTTLDAAGLLRLQGLRLALLEDLRKGLELLGGYHEDGIRRLLKDIVACQHAVQAKQPEIAAKLNAPLPNSPLGEMLGEDAALMKAAPRKSSLSPRAQALVKELEQIEFGTWFEFVEKDQTRVLKLSWFSPTTRNYMFVDNSGQRVAIKPITQLAIEMDKGLVRIMPQERSAPLVDRALTAIYRVLQRFTGRSADETPEQSN